MIYIYRYLLVVIVSPLLLIYTCILYTVHLCTPYILYFIIFVTIKYTYV